MHRIPLAYSACALAAALSSGAVTAQVAAPAVVQPGQTKALRIVTLQPSLTEAVCALGACDRLVGVDRHSDWPTAIEALPRVGAMADANVEAIVALRPDLVLMHPRSRAVERLRALGLRVMALDARTHADIQRNLETIAQALGRPGEGQRLWRQIDARLDAARAQVPPAWRGGRVYLELHSGHAAAGEVSFIGETLTRLGLANVVPASLGAFPKLSPEYVLRADPDLIITGQISTAPPPAQRPGWATLRAVREQRHCQFGPGAFEVMQRPGPRVDEVATGVLNCLKALPAP